MTARILIVDDEVIVAEGIRALVHGMGYETSDVALSEAEALASVSAHPPDLVLMDINLGAAREGIGAAQKIRALHDLPVVFVTAYGDRTTLEQAKQANPFGFVVKPVDPRDVQVAIEMALHSHRNERQLRQRESELRRVTEHLDAVVQATGAATWEWNVQTGEVVFSAPWAAMVGRTLDELAPLTIETWVRLCHPDDLARSNELLLKCFRRELDTYDCECRVKHKDGSWVWVMDRGTVVEWTPDGRPLRMVGAHFDISRHKREQEQRLALQQRALAAQKAESLVMLAGGVAHHVNNLLLAVTGNAEIALAEIPPESPGAEYLREIQGAASKGAELGRRILTYTGRRETEARPVALNELVRHLAPVVSHAFSPSAGVSLELDEAGPSLIGDASDVGQVLSVLLTNALEATEGTERPNIVVRTGKAETLPPVGEDVRAADDPGEGPFVFLEVRDNGVGMSPGALAHLFEPFFSTKMVGRGLGLAAARGVVRSHRGAVDVRSTEGVGTAVRVWFRAATGATTLVA